MAFQRLIMGDNDQLQVEGVSATSVYPFPRAIAATRPNTTNWEPNDAWIDTSDDNQIRLFQEDGTFDPPEAGAPVLGTLLLADTFGGEDGSGWDEDKWEVGREGQVVDPVSEGGATLLSNAGVLAASSSTVNYDPLTTFSMRALITDTDDVNIVLSFRFDATDSYFGIHARHSTDLLDRMDGYWFQAAKQIDEWSVGVLDGDYNNTVLGSAQDLEWVDDAWYKVRFYVVGSDIKATVWLASEEEPGTWDLEETDTTYTGVGKTGVSVAGGAANTLPRRVFIDDLEIRAS